MATARSATPGYNATQIIALAKAVPPNIALLIKGETGVGKSAITHTLARALGLPAIDLRLSLRNEGDMIGLPDQRASQERGVTCFAPPAWLMRACNEPVLLFLDEFNRAEKQVQNAAFQLVLDRQLGESPSGEPYGLHPGTRIIAAINEGMEYSGIEEMDAALLRRFFAVEFRADFADWKRWALEADEDSDEKTNVDRLIVDFLTENVSHWNADLSKVVPGSVFPTPATWHRLSDSLRHMNETPSSIAGREMSDVCFYVSCSAVGTTAAGALRNYIRNAIQNVTAEEIFDPKLTKAERKKLLSMVKKGGIETQIMVVDQFVAKEGVCAWLIAGRLTPQEMIDIARDFVEALEGELQSKVGSEVMSSLAKTRVHTGVAGAEFERLVGQASKLMTEISKRAVAGK
jgi:hypothetical protein